MEGFVARQDIYKDMPLQLSYLFRAKRPIEPLRAIHKPVYKNRPLQPLIDVHHAHGDTKQGLFGSVTKELGEKWIAEIFEDKKPNAAPEENAESKINETKKEMKKRVQKQKIKDNFLAVEQRK